MDLDDIWVMFLHELSSYRHYHSVKKQIYTGVPFLYIQVAENTNTSQEDIETTIKKAAARSMKGKRLHSETIFVRQEQHLFVYRHRFYVPQEKMFCCGNLCVNCVRLRNKK
ncbi:hypothetical protein [Bacillus suaedaesalsae]|uniref:Uncharacterized protein n=1 Tax=Bacillus suaedaesalsae TaxID=2810349 RepID=A0ABS2DJ99_9BACI|nr:hypothetical protein [Bacillus suaedaesalsae]MBM6618576.1 hypothetical protein [Bacillus suaedaesalsae]